MISIHGAPRSGTSWLGKVFDSHPDTAYRFQPLFSYRFKNAINPGSVKEEVEKFLEDLYAVEDDGFILQTEQKKRKVHPDHFIKSFHPHTLVMKEVRYHYLIETLLEQVKDIKIIGIVRHPCGVINSWLKTPREFNREWDIEAEWRDAPSKNQGRQEEYYGFTKWMEIAYLFMDIQQRYPKAFYLLRYEALVNDPLKEISALFHFCGLVIPDQVKIFLLESQSRELNDPDTVFRRADVIDRWKNELDPYIRDAILAEVSGSELQRFLEWKSPDH